VPTGPLPVELRRIADLVGAGQNTEALAAIDALRKAGRAGEPADAAELYFQEGLAFRQRGQKLLKDAQAARNDGQTQTAADLDGQGMAELLRAGASLLRLPLTQSMSTHEKAARALFEVAVLYRNELNQIDKAKMTFQMVEGRYPQSPWARRAADELRKME
jgi:hypothetical protein